MADRSADGRGKRAATEAIEDYLSGLPDDLLQHILSFLPSRDAVRSCLLARHYREQWKSVRAIHITRDDAKGFQGPDALNRFVTCLLLLRNKLPLDEAELNTFDGDGCDFEEAVQCLDPWVRYCLSCKPRKLFVSNNDDESRWFLPRGFTSASKNLTMLQLSRVQSDQELDFSGWVEHEDLKMEYCDIYGKRIFSLSLKRLSLIICSFDNDFRTQIAVPNLISLLMVDCTEMTTLLESMPFLVKAFVRLQNSYDCCENSYEAGDCGDESCNGCCGINDIKSTRVLLEGLSSATKLELTASPQVFIFRRDLAQCPIFSKLKTLLLNEWCLTANHGALICFLQHSPVLEKLILQFCPNHYNLAATGASYNLKKQRLILKDLSLEVKCAEVNDRIRRVLQVFCHYGLPRKNIKIKHLPVLGLFGWSLSQQPSGLFGWSCQPVRLELKQHKPKMLLLDTMVLGLLEVSILLQACFDVSHGNFI